MASILYEILFITYIVKFYIVYYAKNRNIAAECS